MKRIHQSLIAMVLTSLGIAVLTTASTAVMLNGSWFFGFVSSLTGLLLLVGGSVAFGFTSED